jgi:hypothetical protein
VGNSRTISVLSHPTPQAEANSCNYHGEATPLPSSIPTGRALPPLIVSRSSMTTYELIQPILQQHFGACVMGDFILPPTQLGTDAQPSQAQLHLTQLCQKPSSSWPPPWWTSSGITTLPAGRSPSTVTPAWTPPRPCPSPSPSLMLLPHLTHPPFPP